ncbi:MAG TPA: serine/threonine-protein kinase [Gemmatimonadaceae bacterium]|nr:serine/threonine-protein kinase [Gemmatimonadaceae bacterium]
MSPPDEALVNTPEFIGPYRVIRVLGEGGMGTVYEAEETGTFRRSVAVKVVRSGFGSREVRARFEAERQALALMDHPGIATVFQAGETSHGDPFFAMELVKGLPIDDFCDSRRLSTKERLKLFVAVCEAVQHAHQKGVIHRDIKPSNILVTEQNGMPQPKIIDFGIAKALGLKLTEKTMSTLAGTPIGTAAYMSPEQAESSGIDVDTRTDIYSLGVILYLLLVGRLPVEPKADRMPAFIFHLASGDANTPRPSARFNALAEYQEAIASARRTTPEHLERDLSGDLDWITMKALEPQRARRYETAAAFATDVERFLSHEPVVARPPSTGYRLRKFVRRNRAGVAAASVAAAALTVSAVLATAGMVRAVRAERVAAQEAATAEKVSDFLVELFRFDMIPGLIRPDGNLVTARDLLDRGATRSLADLEQQPQLQGRMMHTIGTAYTALGLYAEALPPLQRALTAKERSAGPNDSSVAETELAIGEALAGHGDVKPAEQHFQRAISISNQRLGPNDPLVARGLAGLARLRLRAGKHAEAESLYKRAIAIDEQKLEADAPILARHLLALGVVYWAQRRYADAEPLFSRSLAMDERRLGPDHPDLAPALNNLGGVYWSLGRYQDALPLYERARKALERTWDSMHPNIAFILNNLGETYWKLGRYKEAEPLFRRALTIKEARLPPGDPSAAVTLNGLAGMLRDQGRYKEAEPVYQRALRIRRQALPPGNADIAETVNDYAALLRAMGRGKAADTLLAEYKLAR